MTTDHRELALGKVIRQARARADLSQARLAERVGVTFQQVQKYENGTNRVHFTRLLDLAEGLGTTPEALLREYREVVGDPATSSTDEGREDRDAVRLMGLAHRADERTRKAVIDLLSATLRSDAESWWFVRQAKSTLVAEIDINVPVPRSCPSLSAHPGATRNTAGELVGHGRAATRVETRSARTRGCCFPPVSRVRWVSCAGPLASLP
jgi:transcriptional regulator with XRE-family HTH domain